LIAKNCRGFVDRSVAYEFWNEVARAKKPEDVCPVIRFVLQFNSILAPEE
jgi:hypothetical protein